MVFYKIFYMIYRWHYRRYSLRCCIGYRVLNKVCVYIYIHMYGMQGVFYRYYFSLGYRRWYSVRYSIGYSPRSLMSFI